MNFRTILSSLVPLSFAIAAYSSVQSDIGFTELKQAFGDALPDGSNLSILQVEAPLSSGAWAVAASGELSTRKITFPLATNQPTVYSSHANTVAKNLTGVTTSILPALGELQVASIGTYDNASLRLGQMECPKPVAWDLETHSLSANVSTYNLNALQLLDYRVNRDLVTVLGSLDNGTGSLSPLWGNCYNIITVGTANGQHARGGSNLDGCGRIKPDLVGTATYTSYATPVVASAAGLLIAETKRTAAFAAAKDPRIIKALLMAGATKEEFPSWSHTAAQPLDLIYGAGQVNIDNSYRMLIAGRQPAGTAWRSVKGWDLRQSGSGAVYYFEVPAGQTVKFSTVLTWHRVLTTTTFTVFDGLLPAALDLRLHNSNTSFALGTVVAESTSSLDNVEHIYCPTLPAGRYALEVVGASGTTFGLAWNAVSTTATPPDVVAPAITAQPAALSVTEGQAACFSVTATGSALAYQWSKNGAALAGANSSSYTISATTVGCAGNYSVTVSNDVGSVASNTAALAVTALPGGAKPTLVEMAPATFSARGQISTTEGLAKLFDHTTTTKWLDTSATTWVQVSFAAPVSLTAYSLTSANDHAERDPASWTLSGSTDGSTWTAIETRSSVVFASRRLVRDFALAKPSTAYRYFRLDLVATSGAMTQLAELQFWSGTAAATPPATATELIPSSITARGQNGTTEGVAKLTDNKTTTKWLDFSGTSWVQVTFATARTLDAYSLTSANDHPERDPALWTLSGSNDGVTWTVIESRSGESFATRYLVRDFVLARTSAAYLQYRLAMTAKSGSTTQLAELEFWGK